MKIIGWAAWYICCSTFIYSQNTVSGSVLNSETGAPVSFANVYLPRLEKGTVTDSTGVFEIHGLPDGSFNIIFSSLGYKTASRTLTLPLPQPLTVTLVPYAIEMEETIVSTPFHKLQSENVMKVERRSIAALKTTGAATLAEGITGIAGVESVATGTGIGKPVIRGLSANRVLVYTQGIRLENQQFGDEHGLGVNDAGVESVEVIKGPASLLYGSDALGGVLYINPERFADPHSTKADMATDYFSNTLGLKANAGMGTSGKRFKFLIRGASDSHIDYTEGNGQKVTNSRFTGYDLKTGIGYQATRMKTEVRYNYNASTLGIPEAITLQTTSRTPLRPCQDIKNHILSSKTHLFFEKGSLDLTLGYIFNHRKEFEEEEEAAALAMKLNTFTYNFQYNFPKTGKLETIAAVQGMRQTNKNFGEERLIPDALIYDTGILATSHLHFTALDLQFGLRLDTRSITSEAFGHPGEEEYIAALNRSFTSFNAALGGKTDISESLTARLNFASGFRAPHLAELTSNGTHEGTNRYEIGNPELANEQNFQTDVALEYTTRHVELYLNGFYNGIRNYIYLLPNGDFIDGDPVYLYGQQNARLYGGEAGFHLHPHPLDWLHLESSFETVTGKREDGNYLPLIPANSLTNTFRIEYNNTKKTWKNGYAFVTLTRVFSQEKVSEFETVTGGYSLFNAGIGAELKVNKKALFLRLTARNLLNTVYTAHLSRLKADGIANPGRNIHLSLQLLL